MTYLRKKYINPYRCITQELIEDFNPKGLSQDELVEIARSLDMTHLMLHSGEIINIAWHDA